MAEESRDSEGALKKIEEDKLQGKCEEAVERFGETKTRSEAAGEQ